MSPRWRMLLIGVAVVAALVLAAAVANTVRSFLALDNALADPVSVAEHGGMQRSPDRRESTHSVRQHVVARFLLVPYRIGLHLAHHVDAGVPFRNLPLLHAALRESGYVDDALEYESYPAIWRALRAEPGAA